MYTCAECSYTDTMIERVGELWVGSVLEVSLCVAFANFCGLLSADGESINHR